MVTVRGDNTAISTTGVSCLLSHAATFFIAVSPSPGDSSVKRSADVGTRFDILFWFPCISHCSSCSSDIARPVHSTNVVQLDMYNYTCFARRFKDVLALFRTTRLGG